MMCPQKQVNDGALTLVKFLQYETPSDAQVASDLSNDELVVFSNTKTGARNLANQLEALVSFDFDTHYENTVLPWGNDDYFVVVRSGFEYSELRDCAQSRCNGPMPGAPIRSSTSKPAEPYRHPLSRVQSNVSVGSYGSETTFRLRQTTFEASNAAWQRRQARRLLPRFRHFLTSIKTVG